MILYILLAIVAYWGWRIIFKCFPQTVGGFLLKFLLAVVVVIYFWKDMLSQGPGLTLPIIFTVIVFTALFENIIFAYLIIWWANSKK